MDLAFWAFVIPALGGLVLATLVVTRNPTRHAAAVAGLAAVFVGIAVGLWRQWPIFSTVQAATLIGLGWYFTIRKLATRRNRQ